MRKKGLYVIVMMALFSWAWVSSYSDEEKSRIDNEEFENPKRVACVYDHDAHMEASELEECNTCHHLFEDGKKVEDETSEDQRCIECHEVKSSGDTDTIHLRKAYHTRCKGCHMTEKAGPILCGECHER